MLLSIEKSDSLMYEMYKNLSANIQYSSKTKNIKSILVTSATKGEGKTTVAANLALVMARSNKKVLLIDLDLKNSSIHNIFNISKENGISDIVLKGEALDNVINKTEENLYIITSGVTDEVTSNMFYNEKLSLLLEGFKGEFDYIIIDSSSILSCADTKVLSTNIDATLMVIRSGKSDRKKEVLAKTELDKINSNIIGVVLNDVPSYIIKQQGYL